MPRGKKSERGWCAAACCEPQMGLRADSHANCGFITDGVLWILSSSDPVLWLFGILNLTTKYVSKNALFKRHFELINQQIFQQVMTVFFFSTVSSSPCQELQTEGGREGGSSRQVSKQATSDKRPPGPLFSATTFPSARGPSLCKPWVLCTILHSISLLWILRGCSTFPLALG